MHDTEFENKFLDMTSKAWSTKETKAQVIETCQK